MALPDSARRPSGLPLEVWALCGQGASAGPPQSAQARQRQWFWGTFKQHGPDTAD